MNPFYKLVRSFWKKNGSRQSFRKFNELLFECSLYGLGINHHDGASGETYFLDKLLPQYLPDSDFTFVDVGANVGSYSRYILRLRPDARIIACEPNLKTFTKCQKNLSSANVTVLNVGLGAEASRAKFFDREDSAGSSGHGSLYREVLEDLHNTEFVESEVEITTLDSLVEEQNLDRVHFMKIDTEGHELEVLKGAEATLRSGVVDVIQLEFNEMNVVSRVFYRDIEAVLHDYVGYRLLEKGVYRIRGETVGRELFGFQNLVFVHKRLRPDKHMRPPV